MVPSASFVDFLRRGLRVLCCAALLLPMPGRAETPSFRFAWLSDTHVGSATGEEDLRNSVRDINSRTGISFVIVSGDVTEYGSLEQLRLAKKLLGDLKAPSHVIPGNHDTKWSESGATDFPRLWPGDRFVFEESGITFIGMHEGPIMKMGDGHWSPQDVRWLADTLKNLRDPNQPIIFVTHYPIDEGIANWYFALDLLKKYNIQAILCGHVHRNGSYSFEGVPGVSGRANVRANGAKLGGYTLVDVQSNSMTFTERAPGGAANPPWHKLALERLNFSGDTNHYPRPDYSVNAKWPKVKERWKFETGFTMASSPALWKDSAIVADASGSVQALALKTGKPLWKFKAQDAVYSTPDAARDRVVFGSTDGNVYCLDAGTGRELWRFHSDRPVVASPRISEGLAFIGSSEGKFRALEMDSGKPAWEFQGLGGFVETRPVIYQGKVIFGAWDQHLYALDARTGALVWKWKGDRNGTLFSPAACWLVVAAGKVFIVAPDRKMTALDAKTGGEVWRTGAYMVRETIGASEDQTRFYVRAMQDNFYAFATAPSQPEKLWEMNGGFGYDINSAMLVEKGGVVFYGTKNGLLFAIDGHSGAVKWKHRIGVGLINTVAPLSATQCVSTDFDGRVVLVEAKD